jgi:hypothetical protein
MDKSDIKDSLDRSGFVFTDVDTPGGRVRVTASGPRVPGGEVGRKTTVKAQQDGDVLASRECASNAHAASVYVSYAQDLAFLEGADA